jgi:hypothetical protein
MVVEPFWRAFYHRRTSERGAILVTLIGVIVMARRKLRPH